MKQPLRLALPPSLAVEELPERDQAHWETRFSLGILSSNPTPFFYKSLAWYADRTLQQGRSLELLEVGCGSGRDTRGFHQAGARVTALDISDAALQQLQDIPSILTIRHTLPAPLPFPAHHFDAVYSHFVLSCYFTLDEITNVLLDISRILRPGGELWLSVRSTDDPIYLEGQQQGAGLHRSGESGLFFFSKKLLRRLLAPFDVQILVETQPVIDGERYGALEARATKRGGE